MDIIYRTILYIHVGSAALSIGPFIILIPLLKKLKSAEPNVQQAYIDIFHASIRLIKHSGHILVVSGALLIAMGNWKWQTSWIIATMAVMLGSAFFLARAFTPTIRKFHKLEQNKALLIKKLTWSTWAYLVLLMLMLWFMVTKPVLW